MDTKLKVKVSAKQQRLISESLTDRHATQAAIRAGYSPHTAAQQAARLLRHPRIREILEQQAEFVERHIQGRRMKRRSASCPSRRVISQTPQEDASESERAVLEQARSVILSDVRALFDEHGRLRSFHELSDREAAAIASITIVRRKTQIVQKVRFRERAKVVKMLFRHFGLEGAGVHSGDEVERGARLEAGRKRPAGTR